LVLGDHLDLAGTPGLVEERLERAVEAQDHEPAPALGRLDPVALRARLRKPLRSAIVDATGYPLRNTFQGVPSCSGVEIERGMSLGTVTVTPGGSRESAAPSVPRAALIFLIPTG
jgi:hypothetical protein